MQGRYEGLRPVIWLPVLVFASGIVCIAAAVASGEAEVSLVLIFPVFSGSSGLFLLGTLLIIFSFFLGFAMLAMGQREIGRFQREISQPSDATTVQKETKYGGVVLIGPIPIAFGSDRTTAVIMLIVGIALAIILLGLVVAFL